MDCVARVESGSVGFDLIREDAVGGSVGQGCRGFLLQRPTTTSRPHVQFVLVVFGAVPSFLGKVSVG